MKIDVWPLNDKNLKVNFTRLSSGNITLDIGKDLTIFLTKHQAEEIVQTLRVALTDEEDMYREYQAWRSRVADNSDRLYEEQRDLKYNTD